MNHYSIIYQRINIYYTLIFIIIITSKVIWIQRQYKINFNENIVTQKFGNSPCITNYGHQVFCTRPIEHNAAIMFKRALRLNVDTILVIYCRLRSKLIIILPWSWLRLCYHTIIFFDDKQCYHIMLCFYFLIKNSYNYHLQFVRFFFLSYMTCLCYCCDMVSANHIKHHNVL